MKTLLFLFISLSLSAQLTTTPKVIYRATAKDTVTCGFSPSGSAQLTIYADNGVIDDNTPLHGYRVHEIVLDSGSTIVASAKGNIGYTIYRHGLDVTPAMQTDSTVYEIEGIVGNLNTPELKRLVVKFMHDRHIPINKIKDWVQ